MALKDTYIILDPQLVRIGTLDINGATPFSNDSIVQEIATADSTTDTIDVKDSTNTNITLNANSKQWSHTGTITVAQGYPDSAKMVVGNSLAYWDELQGHWYIMYIYQTEESGSDASGRHITTAYLQNLAAYRMNGTIPIKQSQESANILLAAQMLFAGVNWTVDLETTSGLTADISYDGVQTTQSYFQAFLQAYDVEAEAYVKIDSTGIVTDKVIHVVDELDSGGGPYDDLNYKTNVTGITRTTIGSQIITAFKPIGSDGTLIGNVNSGSDMIVDDEANALYNPDYKLGYMVGAKQSEGINDTAGLKTWAQKVLALYNHPRVNYTVTVSEDFLVPLGANVRVKDWDMEPEMTVESRVIQRTFSKANPFGNSLVLGEFVTVQVVTPSWLTNLTSNLISAVEDARNNAASIKPVAQAPDGNNFTSMNDTKRLILQAWEGSTNISSYIDNLGFIWRKVKGDGSIDTSYHSTGYFQKVPYSALGTLNGSIESDYIMNGPEISFEGAATYLGSFPAHGQLSWNIAQFIVKLSDGRYMTSHSMGNTGNTMYAIRNSSFVCTDYCILANGGHGTSFWAELSGSTIKMYTMWKDPSDSKWCFVTWNWQSGRVTIPTTSNLITTHVKFSEYKCINVDSVNGWMLLRNQKGRMDACLLDDMLAGTLNPKYSVTITDFGFDINAQTYQTQTFSYPWVYWNSGDINQKDKRMLYAANIVHGGQEFEYAYGNDFTLPNSNDYNLEPEGIQVHIESGKPWMYLLNNTVATAETVGTGQIEKIYKMPILLREAATEIDRGEIPIDGTYVEPDA